MKRYLKRTRVAEIWKVCNGHGIVYRVEDGTGRQIGDVCRTKAAAYRLASLRGFTHVHGNGTYHPYGWTHRIPVQYGKEI